MESLVWYLFFACALLGGAVITVQFALMLVGIGFEGGDADLPGDLPDGDPPGELPGDLPGDLSGDVHAEIPAGPDSHDFPHGGAMHEGGHADLLTHHHQWTETLFKIVSFRSVVAACAFFGLAGMYAISTGFNPVLAVVIALGAGLAALLAVGIVMSTLMSLRADGTLRIQRSVGHRGKVYLSIPGRQAAAGKIHLHLQGRLVECRAVTAESGEISTGTEVVVVDVGKDGVVRVETAKEPAAVAAG